MEEERHLVRQRGGVTASFWCMSSGTERPEPLDKDPGPSARTRRPPGEEEWKFYVCSARRAH